MYFIILYFKIHLVLPVYLLSCPFTHYCDTFWWCSVFYKCIK